MAFRAGSIEDVEAWARSEFPNYFAALSLPQGTGSYETRHFDGEYVDGKVILQPVLIRVLEIGWTARRQKVFARFSGNDDVELFSEHEALSPADNANSLRYIEPVKDLANVGLQPPFHHPIDTGLAAGVDRLETLIRYFCLKSGDKDAVHSKLGFFKAHFRAACRDVARAVGAVNEADGADDDDDNTLPSDTPPDLVADTDASGLFNNPLATGIFNAHVHAMDESYHDFKTKMLRELGDIQAEEKNDMAQLQAQIHDLERKLTLSEKTRLALDKELETEKARVKAATEEIANWKSQYDGLKHTLQTALNRP